MTKRSRSICFYLRQFRVVIQRKVKKERIRRTITSEKDAQRFEAGDQWITKYSFWSESKSKKPSYVFQVKLHNLQSLWYSHGDPSVLMHHSGGGDICAPQIGICVQEDGNVHRRSATRRVGRKKIGGRGRGVSKRRSDSWCLRNK